MRIAFITILFFISHYSFSQNKGSEFQINYQMYIDGEYPITYPAILHIQDSIAIYQMIPNLRQQWDGGKIKPLESDKYVSSTKTVEDNYIKINHKNRKIYSFEIMPTVTMLVTDIYPELTWTISDESKNISGYNCIKAFTSYRGRNWIAWFAPDIAVAYGPWKLHGLPGIILEAYDAEGKYTMEAIKIREVKSDIFEKKFEELRTTHNKKPITYRQFLADSDEAMENMVKKINSDGGNAELVIPPRKGLELIYEWEE